MHKGVCATASPKRTPFERERDLAEIARLYLQGKTQQEIVDSLATARLYTLTRQQIAYDLRTIQKRWREASVRDIDDAKAQELARVDAVEREYWSAWEASKKPQRADPRYLDGVMKCIQERCRILGLEAPTRIGIGQDPGAKPLEIDAGAELLSRLASIASRAGASAGDTEPVT